MARYRVPEVAWAFAVGDLLAERVAAGDPAVVYFWTASKTLVLGMQDARLQGAKRAAARLYAEGIDVFVRSSGGRAVAIDEGVLNVTVVVPETGPFRSMDGSFAWMAEHVRSALKPLGLMVGIGEVRGSFCPGRYDLSVGGKKFAGLAQRRTRGAVQIQAFVLVEGTGAARAKVARSFYRFTFGERPIVRPEVMVALAELCPIDLLAAARIFQRAFVRALVDVPDGQRNAGGPLPEMRVRSVASGSALDVLKAMHLDLVVTERLKGQKARSAAALAE